MEFIVALDKPVGQWSIWGSCNASCGSGYQQRTRQCNFKPCPEHLIESLSCNGTCITTPNVTATTQGKYLLHGTFLDAD